MKAFLTTLILFLSSNLYSAQTIDTRIHINDRFSFNEIRDRDLNIDLTAFQTRQNRWKLSDNSAHKTLESFGIKISHNSSPYTFRSWKIQGSNLNLELSESRFGKNKYVLKGQMFFENQTKSYYIKIDRRYHNYHISFRQYDIDVSRFSNTLNLRGQVEDGVWGEAIIASVSFSLILIELDPPVKFED